MKSFWEKLKSYKFSTYLLVMTIFYAMGSLLINLMAIRTFGYYDGFTPVIQITTAGSLISWLIFAMIDIITEVQGKQKAIQTFWIVGVLNVVLAGIAALAYFIPGTPGTDAAYKTVFGANPGIAFASILAFLIGNYINTIVMWVMKTRAQDKRSGLGFTLRVVASTLIGQFLDNAVFYILALAPGFGLGGFFDQYVRCANWGLLWMMVGFTTLIELGVEVAFSPLFHKFAQFLIHKKESEGIVDEAVELNNK